MIHSHLTLRERTDFAVSDIFAVPCRRPPLAAALHRFREIVAGLNELFKSAVRRAQARVR